MVYLISIVRRWLRGLEGELPESLLISLGTVTLALSWPLFNIVGSQPEYQRTPVVPLVTLLMFYQVLPFLVVFALDRLFLNPRLARYAHRPFRAALFLVVFLSFARQAQVIYLPGLPLLPLEAKGAIALATVAILGLVVWKGQKPLALFYLYLAPLALVVTGIFLANTLQPGREAEAAEASLAREVDRAVDGPVFVLIFDGLGLDVLLDEDGDIDGRLFPNFASLAADSVWFPNATSNARFTCKSVPSMLTGRPVHKGKVRCFLQEGFQETNVLSRLTDYYRVLISSGGPSYCYDEDFICAGGATIAADHPWLFPLSFLEDLTAYLFPGFTEVGLAVSENFYLIHRWSLLQFDEFLDLISTEKTSEKLYYFHSTLPHGPFVYSGSEKTTVTVALNSSAGVEGGVYRRYSEQSQFVDLLLGRFIKRLKALGLYDKATIIVTADHGLRSTVIEYAARIPLLIKSQRLQPQRSVIDYQHIDFSNTLLDVLGLPQDAGSEGVSALAEQRPHRDKVFYQNNLRYVYDRDSGTWLLSGDSSQR